MHSLYLSTPLFSVIGVYTPWPGNALRTPRVTRSGWELISSSKILVHVLLYGPQVFLCEWHDFMDIARHNARLSRPALAFAEGLHGMPGIKGPGFRHFVGFILAVRPPRSRIDICIISYKMFKSHPCWNYMNWVERLRYESRIWVRRQNLINRWKFIKLDLSRRFVIRKGRLFDQAFAGQFTLRK